jgi:FkbM family methyltransferase
MHPPESEAKIPAQQRTSVRGALRALTTGVSRLCKVMFVEHRLPIRCYKLYFGLVSKLGIRFLTIRSANGLTVRGYTNSLFMFYETWSKKDYDIPGFTLAGGMTVVDIGANQGYFSLYAASKGATVYAFEPCTENFEILKWNVENNGFGDQVKMFNAAVTGRRGQVPLFVLEDAAGEIVSEAVFTSNPNTGERVQTRSTESVTLDSAITDLHIFKCDLLKVDCEGAEYEILRSTSQDSFRKIARIAMECHENRMEEAAAILRNAGFETVCEGSGWLGILKATNTQVVPEAGDRHHERGKVMTVGAAK